MAIPLRSNRRGDEHRSRLSLCGCQPLTNLRRSQNVSQRLVPRSVITPILPSRPPLVHLWRRSKAKGQTPAGHHRRGSQRHGGRQASTKYHGGAEISGEAGGTGGAIGQPGHAVGGGGRALEEHRHQHGTRRVTAIEKKEVCVRSNLRFKHGVLGLRYHD